MPEDNSNVKLYIANIGENADMFAQKLVNELRSKGVSAEKDLMSRSLKAQMKYADKIGAEYTAVIGDDEISAGKITLKNMKTGEQQEVEINKLHDLLK